MIYAVLSVKLTPGLEGDPEKFAKKFTKYIKENYPDVNLELLGNLSGPLGRMHWVSKHESMGAFQDFNKKLLEEDQGWKSLMDEAQKVAKEKGAVLFTNWERSFYGISDL